MKITFLGNFSVSYSSENHHAQSLRSLGHEVVELQEGRATGEELVKSGMTSDFVIVVHTHNVVTPGKPIGEALKDLKVLGIPTVTYHLDLWFGIERQKDLEQDDFYKHIGYFFTVDKLMADWFNENTEVKGYYLPAGVYDKECYIATPNQDATGTERPFDVIFVGSKGYHHEWQWRPQLINWLKETYGDRFTHVGGDGDTGTIRGAELNQMYTNAKIAIGDSLCLDFDYPYYWSDRIYETTGRGGFIIHPEIKGLDEQFEYGKEIATFKFGDFEDLKNKIDYYLEHEDEREAIRKAGHERTKNNHTYKHRWAEIIEVLGL